MMQCNIVHACCIHSDVQIKRITCLFLCSRRHFEQMVSYFKMDSAEELAHHLVKVKSHVRQSMLRDFYVHHHTEVANLYHVHLPLPESEENNVPKTKDAQIRLKKKLKKSHLPDEALGMHANTKSNDVEMLDIDHVESDCIKPYKEIESPTIAEKEMKYHSNYLQKKSLPSREFEMAEPHTSATFDQIKNVPQDKKKDEANFVSDLLGDTSILDDLFSNATLRQSAALPVRTQYELITAKSKHRSKDFWDILSEQNDESINRLTDLSVIEKVCETSIVSSVAKKEKWNDSLWVNNDKFVWKKTKTSNLEAPSSSKSSNP